MAISIKQIRMKPWLYALISIVLIAAAGTAAYYGFCDRTGLLADDDTALPASGVLVTRTGSNAFGSFDEHKLAPVAATVTKQSALTDTSEGNGSGPGATGTDEPTLIQYSYNGDLSLPNLPVLKRTIAATNRSYGQTVASGFPGWINPDAFDGLTTDAITMSEAGDTGYQISVDFRSGQMSLYRQSSAMIKTAIEPATQNNNATLPSDGVLLAVAHKFLDNHGINYTGYGPEFVQHDNYYLLAADSSTRSSMPNWSQTVNIIFPWEINNTPVVDQGGQPYGLTVTIDTATKTVTSVYNITDLNFTSSSYPLVTDKATILKYAKQGGVYGGQMGTDVKTVTVPLQTPQAVYLISRYQLKADNADYLVPALKFPIGTPPTGTTLYQTSVVVPLVSELLNPMAPIPVTDTITAPAPDTATSSGSATQ